MDKLIKAVKAAEAAYKAEATPENKIALLEAQNALSEAEKKELEKKSKDVKTVEVKDNTADIASAVAKAVQQSNLPPMRPQKTAMDSLIKCDEYQVTQQQGKFVQVGKAIRTNIMATEDQIRRINKSIHISTSAKILVPQKGAEKYLESLSKMVKNKK